MAAIWSATGARASAQPASTTSLRGRATAVNPISVQTPELLAVQTDVLNVLLDDECPSLFWHNMSGTLTSRNSENHRAFPDVALERHHRAGAHDRALLDDGTVEHHRTRGDQAFVGDRRAFDVHVVADDARRPDVHRVDLGAVDHGAVLDRRALV